MDLTPEQKELVALAGKLSTQDIQTLLRFAAFLANTPTTTSFPEMSPSTRANPATQTISKPNVIPRPQQERVVDAIKRLAESYPMLDKKKLLTQTSGLVADHVMNGKPARPVIDEIEAAFAKAYEQYVAQLQGK